MKMPKYLSPTSLGTYEDSPTEFYLKYLATNRPDKFPQTQPMAAGSAFDAYVKAWLFERLAGKNAPNASKFAFETIFEAQVESQNRDWARTSGAWAFEQYKHSGGLADLMTELSSAIGIPSFEFDVMGVVNGHREGLTIDMEVPIFGKPDLRWIHKSGAHIVHDWKVNGFCTKTNTSPAPKYICVSDGWTGALGKPSRGGSRVAHNECITMQHKGVTIASHFLEEVEKTWATQLATYGWLLGESIGADFICCVDQLCGKFSGVENAPLIRVAQHRARISEDFQFEVLSRYQKLWHKITCGHFFDDLTLEESQQKCKMLDANELATTPDMSDEEKMKIKLMRG